MDNSTLLISGRFDFIDRRMIQLVNLQKILLGNQKNDSTGQLIDDLISRLTCGIGCGSTRGIVQFQQGGALAV